MSLCPSIIYNLCSKDSDDMAKQLLFGEVDLPSAALSKAKASSLETLLE